MCSKNIKIAMNRKGNLTRMCYEELRECFIEHHKEITVKICCTYFKNSKNESI